MSMFGWMLGKDDMPIDLKSAQSAITELVKERDSLHAKVAELEGDKGLGGKTVFITGAGGDIGRCASVALCKQGAKLFLVDAAEEPLNETKRIVDELNSERGGGGSETVAMKADVTDVASVNAAVKAAEERFGQIDALFNNAGVQGAMQPLDEYPVEDFETVMRVNVTGAFIVMQAVANSMKATGGGTIVNTASVAALRGTPTMVAYVASKAAVIGMTLTAAKDLAPHNIRVNALSPALIGPGKLWDRQNEMHAASGSKYFDSDPAKVAANKVGAVPLGRLGTMDEVIEGACFLLSKRSSYVTGHNLVISGGLA